MKEKIDMKNPKPYQIGYDDKGNKYEYRKTGNGAWWIYEMDMMSGKYNWLPLKEQPTELWSI